jgi:hypothetical protein
MDYPLQKSAAAEQRESISSYRLAYYSSSRSSPSQPLVSSSTDFTCARAWSRKRVGFITMLVFTSSSFQPKITLWKLPRSKSHTNLKSQSQKPLTFDSLEQNIAATSLFLATKTEENCRKTKEIVIAVAKVAQKNASLIIDEQSKEYWRWRDNILLYEELMLELLTFDVVLTSPYNLLYDHLRHLQIDDNKALRNSAWAFVNDTCLTMLCLLIPPKDIAVAAVYFAVRFTKERIPDSQDHLPWYMLSSNVSIDHATQKN